MLTIFSCLKPSRGHIDIIQRNAINSWTLLYPRPEILLIGNDEGAEKLSIELGVKHIPEVKRNEYGTPLLNSIFDQAQLYASYNIICYINADIMLLGNLLQIIKNIDKFAKGQKYLVSGRRWCLDVKKAWDFNSLDWQAQLKRYVLKYGMLDSYGAMDYFILPKGLLVDIPDFAIGRCRWDNWLLYKTRKLKAILVDASDGIMAIHQNHDYSHTPYNKKTLTSIINGPEVKKNIMLCKGINQYTLLDATHFIAKHGLKSVRLKRLILRYALKAKMYTWYLMAEVLYPYSLPFFYVLKYIKLALHRISTAVSRILSVDF